MKTTAFLFLLALLSAAPGAAEERLIPFEDFLISVTVKDPAKRESPKVEVTLQVERNALKHKPGTAIEVTCPVLASANRTLEHEDVAALMGACAAAMSGQEYRQEVRPKTVYEVVTVSEGRRVRMRRDGEVLFAPQEAGWLKEMLAQATAAEAWYKMLLTARTLPVKTAEARPPQATYYYLSSKVGEVRGKGLGYEAAFEHYKLHYKLKQSQGYGVRMGLYLDEPPPTAYGRWVQRLKGQVELALEAVRKQQAFAYESPPEQTAGAGGAVITGKFSVTANLATQQAEVDIGPDLSMDLIEFRGHVQGSFGVAQLAELRELDARVEAQAKWFTEHEAWFFAWE